MIVKIYTWNILPYVEHLGECVYNNTQLIENDISEKYPSCNFKIVKNNKTSFIVPLSTLLSTQNIIQPNVYPDIHILFDREITEFIKVELTIPHDVKHKHIDISIQLNDKSVSKQEIIYQFLFLFIYLNPQSYQHILNSIRAIHCNGSFYINSSLSVEINICNTMGDGLFLFDIQSTHFKNNQTIQKYRYHDIFTDCFHNWRSKFLDSTILMCHGIENYTLNDTMSKLAIIYSNNQLLFIE